jgi:SAM-dependent methyltransferase
VQIRDEVARRSLELTRQAFRDAEWAYGKPFLDLDVESYRAYREGETSVLPKPYCDDPIDSVMMANVRGKEVLCLAGGGGQQSAVFSLLGAHVTVFDLTPEQLECDERAARHYGCEVTTIQGDMRDLSSLPAARFDQVYQPISTLYVPDLREVYAGVARVLKPGGLYSSDYAAPLLYMSQDKEWDGSGYTLYISEPYVHGAILETKAGKLNFTEGESFSEFHHLLSDILNGLIVEGFIIRAVWENPRPGRGDPLAQLEPGSEAHRHRYLPFGLSVIAERSGATCRR